MRSPRVNLVDELRALVASGILFPGVKLNQVELARQFEASPVPVREALKLLTSEGLVEHDPNRGFHVSRASGKEVQMLLRMQYLLEDDLLLSIEWPTPDRLDEIRQHVSGLDICMKYYDRGDWWLKQRHFLQALFSLSPHTFTVREAIRLWTLTSRFLWLFSNRQDREMKLISGKAHDIADTLADRDRERLIFCHGQLRAFFAGRILEIVEKDARVMI